MKQLLVHVARSLANLHERGQGFIQIIVPRSHLLLHRIIFRPISHGNFCSALMELVSSNYPLPVSLVKYLPTPSPTPPNCSLSFQHSERGYDNAPSFFQICPHLLGCPLNSAITSYPLFWIERNGLTDLKSDPRNCRVMLIIANT